MELAALPWLGQPPALALPLRAPALLAALPPDGDDEAYLSELEQQVHDCARSRQ